MNTSLPDVLRIGQPMLVGSDDNGNRNGRNALLETRCDDARAYW
jgi:hypothetical protein